MRRKNVKNNGNYIYYMMFRLSISNSDLMADLNKDDAHRINQAKLERTSKIFVAWHLFSKNTEYLFDIV